MGSFKLLGLFNCEQKLLEKVSSSFQIVTFVVFPKEAPMPVVLVDNVNYISIIVYDIFVSVESYVANRLVGCDSRNSSFVVGHEFNAFYLVGIYDVVMNALIFASSIFHNIDDIVSQFFKIIDHSLVTSDRDTGANNAITTNALKYLLTKGFFYPKCVVVVISDSLAFVFQETVNLVTNFEVKRIFLKNHISYIG